MMDNEAVVQRTLCLGAIALRSQAENGIRQDQENPQRHRRLGEQLLRWTAETGIDRWFSRSEQTLFARPLGAWTYEEVFDKFWRIESTKALLWAIGCFPEMPTYFEIGDVGAVYSLLPVGNDLGPFFEKAALRSPDVLEQERDRAAFLNWRCRTELLRLSGTAPPAGDSYEAVVARALGAIDQMGLDVPHDAADVVVDGQRFIALSGSRKGHMMSICGERHLALEWVCGDVEDWDKARADT